MKNVLLVFGVLVLGGCAQGIDKNTDIQNSPCACQYNGQPLNTTPSVQDLQEIAELQFSEVV